MWVVIKLGRFDVARLCGLIQVSETWIIYISVRQATLHTEMNDMTLEFQIEQTTMMRTLFFQAHAQSRTIIVCNSEL